MNPIRMFLFALAGTPGRIHSGQYFRNNLFIGGAGGTYNGWSSGDGRIVYMPDAAEDGSYDYDGFGSTVNDFSGRIGDVSFDSIDALRTNTSYKHAVQVDHAVFKGAVPFPSPPFPAHTPVDLSLGEGSAPIDVGFPSFVVGGI